MNRSLSCLRPEQLQSLLESDLPPAELCELEDHLSQCEQCRQRLDGALGDSQWWPDAREALAYVGDGDADAAADDAHDSGITRPANFAPETDAAGVTQDALAPGGGFGGHPAFARHADVLRLLGPTDDPRMLGRIGPYEIAGILGRGGMGVVFKGFDSALNRYVAIKMLLPHLAVTGAARRRFAREAQAAAAVVDDHVMPIHSVAEWQGVPYLVMPYSRGVSLQRRLADQGPLAVREVLRIGLQTARALAAAHAQGLVHRDVSPANILLSEGVERVLLTDFGLARAADDAALTRTGVLAGTPQYMSPEQVRGQPDDVRSDLFSLGSVLYAACTGRAPFRAESSYGVLRLITDVAPKPIREINADMPAWLAGIIDKLMAKRPEERFASAREVADLLEGCLAHVQQPMRTPLPAAVRPKPKRSHFRLTGRMMTMLTTLLVLALVGTGYQNTAPPDIAGQWTGDDWGTVTLKAAGDGEYAGTYTDTFGKQPGEVHLKWSRIERRFNGTWREGQDRFGEISVRLVGDEIRGGWTSDRAAKINPDTPHLADLSWKRGGGAVPPTAARSTAAPSPAAPSTTAPPATAAPSATGKSARDDEFANRQVFGAPDPSAKAPTRLCRFETPAYASLLAVSPDGNLVAVANGYTITQPEADVQRRIDVYELATAKRIASLRCTTKEEDAILAASTGVPRFGIGGLAFSPDGAMLAVGTGLGQVKLFDVDTQKIVRVFDDEPGRLKQKELPEKFNTIPRAMGGVSGLAFSPDGSQLATAGVSFHDFARHWGDRDPLGEVVAGPGRLKVWDAKTGQLQHDLNGYGQVYAIAFSPDGKVLAGAGRWHGNGPHDGGVIQWDPATGRKLSVLQYDATGGTHGVAFSPDSKLLASASRIFDKDREGSTTNIAIAHSRTGIAEWQRSLNGWAQTAAFSPDGRQLIALGQTKVDLLDVATGKTLATIHPTEPSPTVQYDAAVVCAKGSLLIVGGESRPKGGFVEVWSLPHEPAPAGGR